MSEYKINFDKEGDEILCSECGHRYTREFFKEYVCDFCANIVGNSGTVVDKMMLSQAMNMLFEKLKDLKQPERYGE